MAGTIPLSMTQQFDQLGEPLSGGKLYGIQAATVSTPQNFFQDINLALPWPNPITLDAAGRIPQLFIADGLIKIRLTDAAGVVQLVADNVQVIGSSSGGGGGGTIDPLTIFMTGDVKARYGVGVHPGTVPGWVRCNGAAIGAAGSSGSATGVELAHANCQPLFEYLWGADTSLVVSAGRGANAHADWLAGKQIAMPDYRGCIIGGLDGMGNSLAGRITSAFLGGSNPDVLGAQGGSQTTVLAATNLPPHTHGGTTNDDTPDHNHDYSAVKDAGNVSDVTVGAVRGNTATTTYTTAGANTRHHHPFSTDSSPGLNSTPISVMQPTKLCTIYMKL